MINNRLTYGKPVSSKPASGLPAAWLLLLLSLVFSCHCGKSPLAPYGKSFENIMKSDTGIFRGTNFRMSSENIKSIEPEGLKEEDNSEGINYLFYELKVDTSTSYTIAYSCPDNKLKNIETDIYLLNEPQAADLFNAFKKYFNTRYGNSITSGDFFIWSATTSSGKIKIELADESPTYKRGKITLVVRTANEDEQ